MKPQALKVLTKGFAATQSPDLLFLPQLIPQPPEIASGCLTSRQNRSIGLPYVSVLYWRNLLLRS